MNSIKIEKLIEKIEGEATLDFHFLDEKIDFVDIHFPHARGMERILEGRPAEDALVITPRVCGICGHAHLIAAVKALEDCYAQIEISQKAKIIRELTLNFELIQNHIKWFYLTLLPLLGYEQKILLASKATQLMSKAIALLAGQYPHNSYAIVGGVVSDPTPVELVQLENYIQETIRFFEAYMVQTDTKEMLSCEHIETMLGHKGDLPDILNELITRKWHRLGKSFDRFIVFGEDSYFKRGKSVKTRIQPHIDERYLSLSDNDRSLAKNVMYKQKYFEVGPLSRAMLLKTPLIKESHRRFSDSLFSRVLARSCESLQLLHHSLGLVKKIDLSEPSYIVPYQPISNISANGVGAVEAARGSLIHKVALEEGRIQNYQLITPTQWNLSNGDRETPGVAQKAMLGVDDIALAEFVFKTFDVCSVCTTH